MKETEINSGKLEKYLGLMEEVKGRIKITNGLVTKEVVNSIDLEYAYLQVRKILEIIVKAPLIVNEIEYRRYSSDAEKDWQIRTIMKYLSQANPKYYPEPIEVSKDNSSLDNFIPKTKSYLSKSKLKKAYYRCNNFLHAKNPLEKPSDLSIADEVSFINKTLSEVKELLQPHLAHPSKNGSFYYITLSRKEDGLSGGSIFERADSSVTT